MRRTLAARIVVPLLLGVSGCGGDSSPGMPSAPAPSIEGRYILRVEASPFCSSLPVRAFEFAVTATRASSGSGSSIQSFSEFGTPRISFELAPETNSAASVAGRLEIVFATVDLPVNVAEFSGDLNGLFNARGGVTPAPGGRGEVRQGALVGTLELSWSSTGSYQQATCTDTSHTWSLLAR